MNEKLIFATTTAFLLLTVIITIAIQFSYAVTWSSDERLTFDPGDDWDPAITQTSDGKIWVTWHSSRTGNYDIYYKVLSGSSWSDDIQLTSDINMDTHASILQTTDEKIWIIWNSNRTGNMELFYKTSSDNGASWSGDNQLTNDLGFDGYPSIMQASDGRIWVFWTSSRTPTPLPTDPTYLPTADIYYKVSSDAGQTWSEDTLLVTDYKNNYRDDLYPSCMQAANGSIWVAWAKEAQDIYCKVYNGTAWHWEVRLTLDGKRNTHPFIIQTVNDRIWVFWDCPNKDTQYDDDIYYKIFDGSWSDDTQLTTALEDDQWPSAMQAEDLTVWVAWTSPRYPELVYDIFYRTGMELHDLAVRRVTPNASHETFAFRGEMVYTEVEIENQGEGKETFEVKSYANSYLLGSKTISLNAGQSYVVVFQWNTTGVKAGNYILKATAVPVLGEIDTADNTLTYNTYEIRIKGDMCGWYGGLLKPIPNQRVDMDDFGMVVGHWGTANPTWHPVWGPAADITEDGLVDLDDIMEVAIHFLET